MTKTSVVITTEKCVPKNYIFQGMRPEVSEIHPKLGRNGGQDSPPQSTNKHSKVVFLEYYSH